MMLRKRAQQVWLVVQPAAHDNAAAEQIGMGRQMESANLFGAIHSLV